MSPSGDVFVGSPCQSQNMERFAAMGGLVGTWTFPGGYLGSPNGVALDASANVYATDYNGNRIYKLTSSGAFLTRWISITTPVDVAVSRSGDVFVVGLVGQQVQKFTNVGFLLATIGSAGVGPGQFQDPIGIALDDSSRIYVADAARIRILRFLANGNFDMEFTPPITPYDMAMGPDGNVYVIGFDSGTVYQYSSSGALLLGFTSPLGLSGAFRIAISPAGTIYITEQSTNRVTVFQIDNATPARRMSFGRLKTMYR